ncbi:hypothetical protein POTOM_011401 [Populus tomentosa]|uniref:Uncharacterized protein n=1 Tax=Populus tomentosa TaxID=118781 RepID=A0A8X8DAG7_POPTO|nr:hypothetical protein POTOM_011401 [Populus tomentosa]
MVQAQARIFALHSNSALVRGENTADSVTIDELYIGDTVTPPTAGKPLSNMKMPPSVVSSIPSSQSRAQGRIVAMSGQMTYQGAPQHNQINRTSTAPPLHSLQRIPAQNRSQPPAQQEVQCPSSDSQASSPPKIQGNRRGSFLYGGIQVMGATRNVGVGHGDQNFPGATFFLASISVVLEFLRLPWRFPDKLLSRNDMWQIDASDEADVFRWSNEII